MAAVGPQFQQLQLTGLGGEQARPIARVENPATPSPAPSFRPGRKGEQLKMFMTPSEIHERYQPLDADRHEVGHETYRTGSTWDPSTPFTGGSEGVTCAATRTSPERPRYGNTSGGGWYNRTSGGNKWVTHEARDERRVVRPQAGRGSGLGRRGRGLRPQDGRRQVFALVGRDVPPSPVGVNPSSHRSCSQARADSSLSRSVLNPAHWTQGPDKSSWESSQRYHPGTEGAPLHEDIGEHGVTHPSVSAGTSAAKASLRSWAGITAWPRPPSTPATATGATSSCRCCTTRTSSRPETRPPKRLIHVTCPFERGCHNCADHLKGRKSTMLIADIASGNTGTADVLFLIAAILFGIAALSRFFAPGAWAADELLARATGLGRPRSWTQGSASSPSP